MHWGIGSPKTETGNTHASHAPSLWQGYGQQGHGQPDYRQQWEEYYKQNPHLRPAEGQHAHGSHGAPAQ
jgi:hypothetical protein